MSQTLHSLATGLQVGAVLPLLIAVVQRPNWSTRSKQIVAVVASLIAGVITVAAADGWAQFQQGKLTTATIVGVLLAAQTSYDVLWKPTKLAPVIEAATSPKSAQQAG